MPHNLDPIFKPKRIAVIGGSKKEGTLGHKIMHNLIRFGYEGIIYPVNPKTESVLGLKCYPSVLDIPESIDLAVIIVPKEYVGDVIDQCGEKGIKGIVVISAGFREIGGEGIERERKLVEQIRKYNMRMVGPNCMGVFNTNPEIHMNANFAPAQPLEGHIGFISQSGALGAVILEVAHHLQLGISIFTSMGNKADISGNDLLEYYFEDEQTNLILMYLESFGNPRRFLQIARKITKDKPIIVVKAGTTEAGAKAASSHTGALADSDTTIDAMLHQCGVLRVSTIEEMFALGMAFAHQPLPKGNRVAVLTNAGGPGILATDAVISEGLSLAKFSAETEDQLKELLPEEASIHNPVDMIATADQDSYKMALEIILKDENVDSVLVIFVTPILVKSIDVAHKIVEVLSKHQFKTVVTCLMGHEGVLSGVEKLEKHKIPVYRFPESAAKALAAMETYKTYRQKEDGTVRTFPVDKEKAQAVFAKVKEEGRKSLNNSEIQQALEAYGFLFARCIRVQNAEEAIAFASELNTSIVVKVQSEDIIHKSDVGGVKVDLRTEKEIRQAFAEMHDSIKKHYPEAQIEGYTVQEMIKGGKETVLGINADPKCGPVIMFGRGGIYVEVLKDVSFRIAPLTDMDALEMIESLKSYPLLKGIRGEEPVDIDIIVEYIQRLSQFATDFDMIKELDINPFMVCNSPDCCKVVDARIMLK